MLFGTHLCAVSGSKDARKDLRGENEKEAFVGVKSSR
jgi:hypothetical protein